MDSKLKETVYSPESGIRKPLKLLKDMLSDLNEAHSLGIRLAKRNIKAMYRQSVLGYVWSVLPPLLTSLVWVFLNGQSVVNISETDVPYPLFVITGTMLWQIFSESVSAPLKGVISGKSMLAKINFPRESLILTGIYTVFFNTFIKMGLIVFVFAFYGFFPSTSVFFALFGIISLIIFGSMIGLLLTPLGMLYTDINKGMAVVLQFAIYLTPVIYPEPKSGIAAVLMKFNPVAPLITTTRNLLLDSPAPRIDDFVLISVISLIMFFFGLFLYRLSMPIIIERVGS